MRSKKEIEDAIRKIENDERLKRPTATIDVNAPLALIQFGLKEQIKILKWVLQN